MKIFAGFFILLAFVLLLIGSYQAIVAVERDQLDVLILAITAMFTGILLGATGERK